jgi:hypothetical protein
VTANLRAFRVLVRNAMFRRVELAARRRWDELGELDREQGWSAERWQDALAPYFDDHSTIQTGANARGPALLIIDAGLSRDGEGAPVRTWRVRQILDDPAGDHDWGITAEVDLDRSDAEGVAVVRLLDVAQL